MSEACKCCEDWPAVSSGLCSVCGLGMCTCLPMWVRRQWARLLKALGR